MLSGPMKDQYVGDYNDFVKYALLHAILAQELPLLVCWILTRDDGSTEGGKLGYLDKPSIFRPLDPAAFDTMADLVANGSRSVAAIEASGLLPDAGYFSRLLEDHSSSPSVFFRELWRQPRSVVFFDPDNGLEIASKPRGRRDSAIHLLERGRRKRSDSDIPSSSCSTSPARSEPRTSTGSSSGSAKRLARTSSGCEAHTSRSCSLLRQCTRIDCGGRPEI
jgi:hypothetical protein